MGEVTGAVCARRLYWPKIKDVAGPTGSPVEAEEIVAAGATAASHVSWPCQASLGPRRFTCVHGPRRAHRGPGGYCRHSGNRGTTGRPARAHKVPRAIFAKDQSLQAWRASRGFFPREGSFLLAEGSLPWRGTAPRQGVSDATRNSAKDQAEGLGEAFLPREAPSSRSHLCLRGRAHMGSAPCAE